MVRNSLLRLAVGASNAFRRLSDRFGRLAVDWSAESAEGGAEGESRREESETRELSELRREMLSGVLEMGKTVAREVMVPRTEMVCIAAGKSLREVLAAAVESEHSRIPVYEEKIDNIIGVLYSKDLLKVLPDGKEGFTLRSILRPAYFIPETKSLAVLMREFQRNRVHMAIVVDEYGGVSGLVTLEDILEEIIGEIEDEYDETEERITRLENGDLVLDARLGVEEIEELLNISVEKAEFESLGGLAIFILGHLPAQGESFTFEGWRFTVEKATDRKVVKIRVQKADNGHNDLPG